MGQNEDRNYAESSQESDEPSLPIVAIGASAGGLGALESVFAHVPVDGGCAYVVIQHLSPDFESHMTGLLARVTRMPVLQAIDAVMLEPNRVYVIPPKKEMILSGDKLLLTDKDPRNAPSLPIDTFLRSLAQERGNAAIAVILSGTGSDGARGVRAMKSAGGYVIVQDPSDAEFDGMPHNAVATGVADVVIPAANIGAELARLLPIVHANAERRDEAGEESAGPLQSVVDLLAEHYDVDFSVYKEPTLLRRIKRRIELTGAGGAEAYARSLAGDAEERKRLYQDILIGVTDFFRDPSSYEALEHAMRTSLFQDNAAEVRVWVAGCATGEEVYSVAMLLDEIRRERNWTGRIRLFATDIQHEALKKASTGVYAREAVAHVSRERLERYFTVEGSEVRVVDQLREMVIFATHNLVSDAPFTQLDLICCRNVLIYFQPPTQARVLGLFHFGLRTGGLLFLGPSETLGKFEDEFDAVAKEDRIYSKRRDLRLSMHSTLARGDSGKRKPSVPRPVVRAESAVIDVYESLLERYVPSAFLLNDSLQLVHCFRGAERYLAFKGGRMSTSLTGLLDGRMRTAVAGLLERFKQEHGGTHAVNVRGVEQGLDCRVTVSPVVVKSAPLPHVLVEIEPIAPVAPVATATRLPPEERSAPASEYVDALENDLRFARNQLQLTVEELEAANEELQAANEELIASNEELQSTNEELRSVNEELNNVNTEHQDKISQLIEVTNDLEALLHTINVGVLFLDEDMCIRRANRRIGDTLHILPQDVGRSFAHFQNNLDVPGVYDTARRVMATGEALDQEIRTPAGQVLLLSVIPYGEPAEKRGVVLTIVDVTTLKAAEAEARRLSTIVRTARDAIISYSLEGRILSWNAGAERLFGYSEAEALGQNLRLIVPDDLLAETERLLAESKAGRELPPFETTRITRDGSRLSVLLSVAPVRSELGVVTGASAIAIDVTARKQAEERAAIAVEQREKFLALLSHELRNPLMAIVSANEVLTRSSTMDAAARGAQQVISRQVRQMSRLLEDTLDASRMRHDKIEVQRKRVDLRTVLEAALDATRPRAKREGIVLEVDSPAQPIPVRADATRLQQVIVNLTQNAINHSQEGGSVRVRLTAEGGTALVSVEDDGDGIEPDVLPRLFEPFFQASRRSRAGLGLGLSLARSIARAHDGDITATSAGVGRGARFEMRLPVVDPNAETAVDLPRVPATASPTVVLVDDDAESRESLGFLLRNAGYEVFEATDGESGVKLIAAKQPSVAVLDIGLPDMSGLEVARRVRRQLGSNQVRLIALTGFGRQEDREAAAESGCDMHLVKPVDFATLEQVIAYQVAR